MLGITDLTTYLLGTIIIVLLPGPNSMYVLSVAAKKGVRVGFSGAFGVFLGDTILMTLAATGAASMLKTYPALFAVIKYAGGGYLAWLGINMLRAAFANLRKGRSADASSAQDGEEDMSRPFPKALAISLMNPKAILFFVSFFVQFVDPAYPYPVVTFIALGGMLQICSAIYLTTIIVSGVKLAEAFRKRRKLAATMSGGVGMLFLGFGAKLAAASLK